MKSPEEVYWGYVNWCLKIGVPPLSRPAYEKALDKLPELRPNADVILNNNRLKKDK